MCDVEYERERDRVGDNDGGGGAAAMVAVGVCGRDDGGIVINSALKQRGGRFYMVDKTL